MSTRCSHVTRPDQRCTRTQQRSPAAVMTTAPPGRFVQVMAGELARFASAHALGFDDRCLLEHLLLAADHRSGVIAPFSLTDLARDLGLGPSGRRTVRGRLDRLAAAGAITWESPSAGRGRLEVLVYSLLVHAGAADRRRGFVQLVPSALATVTRHHGLSPTAAALLPRLALQADARSHEVATTTASALGAELALGWRRLGPALDELVASGLVEWKPGRILRVLAYELLVRSADGAVPPASVAARSAPGRAAPDEDRAPQAAKARDRASSFSRVRDQDTPPAPPTAPVGDDQPSQGWGFLVELEATLTEPQRQALRSQADRGRLAQLGAELDRLLEGGWEPEALMGHVGAPLPGTWRSPARLLCARAQALPSEPPDPEALRAEAAAAERAAEVVGARHHARNLVDVDFLDAGEIVATLGQTYTGAALEAALAVVAAHRSEEYARAVFFAGPSSADDRPGPDDRPVSDDSLVLEDMPSPRRRRTEATSAEPTSVGYSLPAAVRRAS